MNAHKYARPRPRQICGAEHPNGWRCELWQWHLGPSAR